VQSGRSGTQDDLKENLITVDHPSDQGETETTDELPAWFEAVKVLFMIAFWYALNLGYNVYNKATLNLISAPWTLSTMQLCLGLFIFGPLWGSGLRAPPNITMQKLLAMFPLGVFHALTHLSAVIALGAGHVSSFQILKAAEPLFTCFFSGVIMRKVFAWYVYLTIVPIIVGVGYSAMGNSNGVNMLSLTGAMMSNLGSALRGIYSKIFMNKRKEAMEADPDMEDDRLTAANMYALITIHAILVSFPFAVWFEIAEIASTWNESLDKHEISSTELTMNALASGVFYYTYNEVAFVTLSNIHAVTHAVANTFKRIILIVCTAIIFSEKPTTQFITGSFVAIAGVFAYSLAKLRAAKEAAKQ